MKCETCGQNEAINDFYRECEGCIKEFEMSKEAMIKELKQILRDYKFVSNLGFTYIPIQFLNRFVDRCEAKINE